jgi:hypothetical protein
MWVRGRSLPVLFALLATAATASAQGGYTTEKHPDLGLTFPRARDYEQVPVPPDEEQIVLHFIEKLPPEARESTKVARPELYVLWIDHLPDPPDVAPKTGGDTNPPPAPGGGPEGKEKPEKPEGKDKKDKDAAEAKPPPRRLPVNSLERFVQQRLPDFKLAKKESDAKPRQGWSAREYTLTPKKGSNASRMMGWAFVYTKPEREIVFLGLSSEDDLKKHSQIWHASSDRVDFDEPEQMSTAKLEQIYARSKFSDPPFRINVRKKLVRGWQAQDLDNYIVIYDTPDQPLMRKVFRDLELIRKEYEKLFPPEKPVTAVSTVRVCKNREEYLAYGGWPQSAGYWNSETQELVLYDAEHVDKDWKKSDADTFIVLYHEAFHQFIHYSAGELPPHSWFNEGTGDFFSGALLKDGKMRGIGANPWRLGLIQHAIGQDLTVPWKDIIRYEQAQYYANPAICYAQGWSMIYFLRTSKLVAAKPEWARILPTYFDALKSAYREELAKLDETKRSEQGPRGLAGLAARQRAVDAAFQGVDIDALEGAWRKFTLDLPAPDKR